MSAGYGVSVICPRQPGEQRFEVLDGVRIHRYWLPGGRGTAFDFVVEYAVAFLMTVMLTVFVAVTEGFDVLQVCNPPDVFFPLGVAVRLMGKGFVFDHHDLTPELYACRFGPRQGIVQWLLRRFERATFRVADHVISTNDSYREVAIGRGRVAPDRVTVVRNGPDPDRFRLARPSVERRDGHAHLCVWYGVMGRQDGLDLAMQIVGHYVHGMGRRDCQFAFLGDGDALEEARVLAGEQGIGRWVTFTGWLDDAEAGRYLVTADLGLSTDPEGPLSDKSTMVKVMEYMSVGLPIVAFDLTETRVSAAGSAAYVTPGDTHAFAATIARLLDDPGRRAAMGAAGRQRVATELAWDHQASAYVEVYRRLLGRSQPGLARISALERRTSGGAGANAPGAVKTYARPQPQMRVAPRTEPHSHTHPR